MKQVKRIIIVGHPGAGKTVLGKTIAEKLGWTFIDADFGLELQTGLTITDMLGVEGASKLRNCEHKIITQHLNEENIVMVTDAGIICSEKNRNLLKSEYVIFVTMGLAAQLERLSRHTAPLIINSNLKKLLEHMHERDNLFTEVADITINTDDNELHSHVEAVLKHAALQNAVIANDVIQLENRDLTMHHKLTHKPIELPEQQAICLKLLAGGKTAKEIARELDISYRTVEGHIAKTMELLGCTSSKELIALYLCQP